ncbi:hypothetical protein EBZ80_23530 [bacterium]|nr:hypothetical protein [bacterium]
MFDLNAYLADDGNLLRESLRDLYDKNYFRKAWAGELPVRRMKYIRCADGLEFSAQASAGHYCTPRQNLGPYVAVEIGFPNQRVEEFMEYAEDPKNPTGTVYGWVPVEVVEAVVNKHGGLACRSAASV